MLLAQCKNLVRYSLLVLTPYAVANEADNDKLQLSGFATLGAVYSDSTHHGYRKDVSSDKGVYSGEIDLKQHSLLGLQANWAISPSFDFVYQGVLRDLPEPSLDRYTTLAFLRYEMNTNWSFRAGRTAPDLFLLTEYRDVDFSYPWATAPNEIYGIIPYRSIDGVDVTYSQRVFGGVFKTKLFTGSSEAEISATSVVEEIKIEDLVGLSISFDNFNWIVQAKYTQATIANDAKSNLMGIDIISQVPDFLWPNANAFAQSLRLAGKQANYASVSGQYVWQDWLASAELARITSENQVFPSITSGYSALSYQLDAHQVYGIFAFTNSDYYVFNEPGVNRAALGELIQGVTSMKNFYATNQQTFSLGWRWDITNYMASTLQWNHTKLDEQGATLWLTNPGQEVAENVNTYVFSVSMVF